MKGMDVRVFRSPIPPKYRLSLVSLSVLASISTILACYYPSIVEWLKPTPEKFLIWRNNYFHSMILVFLIVNTLLVLTARPIRLVFSFLMIALTVSCYTIWILRSVGFARQMPEEGIAIPQGLDSYLYGGNSLDLVTIILVISLLCCYLKMTIDLRLWERKKIQPGEGAGSKLGSDRDK